MPATKSKFGNFEEVVGETATLHILYKNANHKNSMRLLDEAGLEAYTSHEILLILTKDETLKNELKGKWFYLAEKGMDKDGIFTIDDKGELIDIKDKGLSLEMRVRTWSWKNPLSLCVNSDDYVAYDGWRFLLNAGDAPNLVAPVVVGKPKGR